MATNSSSGQEIRRGNRQAVMSLLAHNGPTFRSHVCKTLGLTGAGLSRIVRELIDAGLVDEESVAEKGVVGRRRTRLQINPDGAYVLAVSITANRLSVALSNAAHSIVTERALDPADKTDAQSVIRRTSRAALEILKSCPCEAQRVVGVGVAVGVPAKGTVSEDGTVTSGILGWNNVRLAKRLSKRLSLPVRVEARAPALLKAELAQSMIGRDKNVYLINCGVGSGSAALIDGVVHWSGHEGFGGLSHLPIPGSSIPCHCGRVGCLEQSATGVAVVGQLNDLRRAVDRPLSELGPAMIDAIERARSGDKKARSAFYKAGERMAYGIDVVQALLSPQLIILAGETGRQPDYVEGLKAGLIKRKAPISSEAFRISKVTTAQAAASVALDAFVFSRHINIDRLLSK